MKGITPHLDESAHFVITFYLHSYNLNVENAPFVYGDFIVFYHEERLYSVKNRKTGIVFLVYANSYPDAIRRVKNSLKGA